ncbi:glutathione S-transferase N-terminal domain-containing protein [Cohaesibacter sp. CAU 1516]|uniref:glutathione S-transferase N-terminal domain-containing protein n=1 Tax=Cohaesibacter sp. CAU 1516 TaxID=2576038 RepID=UPI002484CC2F|nr:glutathione S-transferase N-terminal domain-containing protein [Cohaesibacter sp. CAU 1516]
MVRNPLGKVPTLILENEEVLYDSRVILDCLYERKGKAAFQFRGPDKYQGLIRQALARMWASGKCITGTAGT